MSASYLTEQQLANFRTFGFLAFPGLLADRIERISATPHVWASADGNRRTLNGTEISTT